MAAGIQVTFDAADPEKLVEFWGSRLTSSTSRHRRDSTNWQEFAARIGLPEEQWHTYAALIDAEHTRTTVHSVHGAC